MGAFRCVTSPFFNSCTVASVVAFTDALCFGFTVPTRAEAFGIDTQASSHYCHYNNTWDFQSCCLAMRFYWQKSDCFYSVSYYIICVIFAIH